MSNSNTIEHNKDELNPPDFLNKEFFEKILRDSEKDEHLQITKLDILPGSNPGDHFGSVMFKAVVTYSSKENENSTKSLVVKLAPVEEGLKMEFLQDLPIFDREIQVYTKILSEMKKIMESIEDDEELAPRLLYYSTKPQLLVLEDVRKFGYGMHYKFFDFDNTVKILKKLAKFHALSYYMNDNKYVYKTDLTAFKTIIDKAILEKMNILYEGFDYLSEEVKNWPGFDGIAAKLATQKESFIGKLLDTYQPNPEPGFNVLCHGDFHLKNMMFIKHGGEIQKTMFLDFQTCFWGSPAIDLIYILYGIGGTECRARRGEILSIYHKTLSDYLKRLGCMRKPPTVLDLNIEMLKMGTIELLWSVCYLQFYALDFTKISFEDIFNPSPEVLSKMRKTVYTNEEIVKVLKEVLPELYYKGILA
uniref:Putative ecdysteroid kinase n=1 Tax=Nyssomyia neivai TaxID=330878 RepID=A0A1L8DZE5_9DIPT